MNAYAKCFDKNNKCINILVNKNAKPNKDIFLDPKIQNKQQDIILMLKLKNTYEEFKIISCCLF